MEGNLMKAMMLTNFGEPEVLTEREVNKPTPRENEVLVKVYATSVNPVDIAVKDFLALESSYLQFLAMTFLVSLKQLEKVSKIFR
jgi:NADPH:quinone reductase-like Zn-dependent oxidoreductase